MILSIEEGPWGENHTYLLIKSLFLQNFENLQALEKNSFLQEKLEETIYNPGRTLLKYKAPPAFSCEINTTFTPKCLEMSHEMQFLI